MSTKKPVAEPETKNSEETEVRQSAVVASTFANVELQSTKQTLQQYVQLYQSARDELQRLTTELAERDKDSMSVVHYLRKEIEKSQETLKEHQKTANDEVEKLLRSFNEERRNLSGQLEENRSRITFLEAQVADLEADIDALSAFKRERTQMYQELQHFREQEKATIARYEAEISALRFQSLEEKVRLKAEERSLSEKFEKEVNARAMQLLDSKTKEIHSENYLLIQDKVLLEKELERLSKQNQESEVKLRADKLEAELGVNAEAELVKRNAKLARANKTLTEKTVTLEQQIAQLVEKYERKYQDATGTLSKQLAAMTSDRDDANRNAATRHKELVRMRQLTKQVVAQRSDLEVFFNEALEYVRSEIAREKMADARSIPAPPPLGKGAQPARRQQAADDFFHGNFEPLPVEGGAAPSTSLVPASAPGGPRPEVATRGSRHGSSAGSSLPPIAAGSGHPRSIVHQAQPSGVDPGADFRRVDISELSWLDKERVLRILFAKINQIRHDRDVAQPQQKSTGLLPSVHTPAIEGPRRERGNGEEAFMTEPAE